MFKIENHREVRALHMGRDMPFTKRPFMSVRCYAVDGIFIDSGMAMFSRQTAEYAATQAITRAYLTHHHEDHSGGAAGLFKAGIDVFAGEGTRTKLARGFITYPYQWLVWGHAPRARVSPVERRIETPRFHFDVHDVPGHCPDMVVYHEPNQGWLFSGDLFLAERVKNFRADEDFSASIGSLRKILSLDFDTLFCAHRPQPQGGKAALARKLQFFLDIEGEVRRHAAMGKSVGAIAKGVLGAEDPSMVLLTLGDVSKRNMVRSILHGARTRREFALNFRRRPGHPP